jgi:hypothetical protein
MTIRARHGIARVFLIVAGAALLVPAVIQAAGGRVAAPSSAPVLVAIRASHHAGFDRVVFEFNGSAPAARNARYVSRLLADPSGRPIAVAGRAILALSLSPASAHDGAGRPTVPGRVAFALPNVMTLVRSGDFESVVSYGIGLAQRNAFHISTLHHPSRVVIDISATSRTVFKRVYFVNQRRFAANQPPFVSSVLRPVLSTTPATALMDRLFAGPTAAEQAAGLRLLVSAANGYTHLSIAAGVARIRLTGGCSSGGATISIAQEITPTLKQLANVHWVKIFDPAGRTEHPTGASDSIPACLEP